MLNPRCTTALALVLLLGPTAQAQIPDHLKCQQVKDSADRREVTADLGGLIPESGCVVRLPAKLFCEEATKTNVDPPAQGGSGPAPAGRFLCYKVRCPRRDAATLAFSDQFGTHTIEVGSTKLLCAPGIDAGVPCDVVAAPCGACGAGLCVPVTSAGGVTTLQCVDEPTCVPRSGCDTPCDPGQVCQDLPEQEACCAPCP
jgi:hypothetical protein